jgi:bifunctional DNA-binding transcriptional regulator/antitoxin component of YhaV-PrlF toxin-antitoxin module
MAVVTVDERGRITIPKEMGIRGTRAVVIPAGSFIIAIPLPEKPEKVAEGWLETGKTREELGALAEEEAKKDATTRAKRRRQA